MRFFPVLFILSTFFLAGSAPAQENAGGPSPANAGSTSPSTDEYSNIPPGILMSGGSSAPVPAEAAPAEEEVMSMDDLLAAYDKGQFEVVVKHLMPIANSGYPQAEEMLGIMYRKGEGVPKNFENAIMWLTKAAEAGRPLAQHYLATINFTGEGVPADSVKALMWLYLAIVHYPDGPEKTRAMKDRDNISLQVGRRDKVRAFELAHDWLAKRDETALLDQLEQPP